MREAVFLMLLCYLAGIVVGNLVFILYLGPVVIFTIVVGWLAGVPVLVVAILIFFLFRRSIVRHPLPWCVAAPFLIAALWLAFEWNIYSSRAPDMYWFLSLRGVWDRTALVLSSASFASALFWYCIRHANGAFATD
jgi:hypothetical protein